MRDVPRWLEALGRGELPPVEANLGDALAMQALRQVMGELALPAMAQASPAAAHQVIRTMLWHLDRLIDRPDSTSRASAIEAMANDFREAWTVWRTAWDQVQALLQSSGRPTDMAWDALQGQLNSRAWADLQSLSDVVAQAPDIVALIRRLGRGVPRVDGPVKATSTQPVGALPERVTWRPTRMEGAPGHVHGVKLGGSVSRMVAGEAAQLRHPVLRKLWRARLAESRLQVWDESADWVEAVRDDHGAWSPMAATAQPPRERGPIIVCVDTSGSMRGAPERLAKAVVLEVGRTAHREGRACLVMAFGGPGEVVSWSLDFDASGLEALIQFTAQAFDGGTDVATPIEQAVMRVQEAGWHEADVLIVSDGEFGATPKALAQLDAARAQWGLRVQGLLIGDRETMGLLEVSDHIHWVRDWRRFDGRAHAPRGFSPVHSRSLTAMYFPNALSARAQRHQAAGRETQAADHDAQP